VRRLSSRHDASGAYRRLKNSFAQLVQAPSRVCVLRTYRLGGTEALLEAAMTTAAAA
jgi:hypothetical protein